MSVPQVCVVYVLRDGPSGAEVLLGRKLTGLGRGKVVAPGGKLEIGETATDAAMRELREEVGSSIVVDSLREVGVNRYRFPTRSTWDQDSHVFVADWRSGEPAPSTELEPRWTSIAGVPYDEMWSDAQRWLPAVLAGAACGGEFVFASDLQSLSSAVLD